MSIQQKINGFLSKNFRIEIISTKRESIKFAKKYFKNKKIVAAEIGVFFGYNAKDINKSLNISKLYLIDPYAKYEEYKKDSAYPLLKRAKKNSHKINKKNNILWIEEFSDKALKDIKEDLDLLYVDGNHEYEFVKKDLELYWKKIKKGGIIAGHEIQYKGVSKALLEFANKNNLEINFGDRRDWWIIKNGFKNIEVFEKAISNKLGKERLYLSNQTNVSSMVKHEDFNGKIVEVETETIDNFCKNKKIDFIRMDVEGVEYEIFQGMENLIKSKKPLKIMVEFHSNKYSKKRNFSKRLEELKRNGFICKHVVTQEKPLIKIMEKLGYAPKIIVNDSPNLRAMYSNIKIEDVAYLIGKGNFLRTGFFERK